MGPAGDVDEETKMFADLQQKILQLTADRKSPLSDTISRTFFFLSSPLSCDLRTLFQQWFPIADQRIADLYPWIQMKDDETAFRNEVEIAVKGAFNASRIDALMRKGISIRDSINQVLVIADLCEPDACARISKGVAVISEHLGKRVDLQSVYWTAILYLRTTESGHTARDGDRKDPEGQSQTIVAPKKGVIKTVSETFEKLPFHRVFFLDVSSPLGTCLSRTEQACLACHLLHFLTSYPVSPESGEDYAEWIMNGRAHHGLVSGFCAHSTVLPIDQILETVAVFQSAEVIGKALLEQTSTSRPAYYLNHFLAKNSLLQIDEVQKTVSEDQGFSLPDPTANLPDFKNQRPEDYIETMQALDASLPRIAGEQAELMRKIGERRQREWFQSLEDHLEAIIAQEPGGLIIAREFLEGLQRHLEVLIPKELQPPQYNDPGPDLSHLRHLINTAPREEAIYTRSLVLGIVLVATAMVLFSGLLLRGLLAFLFPASSLFLGRFASHYSRQKLENQISQLQNRVRAKWKALIDSERRKNAKLCLENLLQQVNTLKSELVLAIQRVEEIVNYFRNTFIASFPEESALWRYVVKEREKVLQYAGLCEADMTKLALDYIDGGRPSFARQRLSPPGGGPPNSWECRLIEDAALRLLPGCSAIVNQDILSFFLRDEQEWDRCRNALTYGAVPFLNLQPGSAQGEGCAVVEAGTEEEHPLVIDFIRRLGGQFPNAWKLAGPSAYRLSLFAFVEGCKMEDVLIR